MTEYLITLVNVCYRSRKSNYKMLYNPYFVKSILNDYICTGKDTGQALKYYDYLWMICLILLIVHFLNFSYFTTNIGYVYNQRENVTEEKGGTSKST